MTDNYLSQTSSGTQIPLFHTKQNKQNKNTVSQRGIDFKICGSFTASETIFFPLVFFVHHLFLTDSAKSIFQSTAHQVPGNTHVYDGKTLHRIQSSEWNCCVINMPTVMKYICQEHSPQVGPDKFMMLTKSRLWTVLTWSYFRELVNMGHREQATQVGANIKIMFDIHFVYLV